MLINYCITYLRKKFIYILEFLSLLNYTNGSYMYCVLKSKVVANKKKFDVRILNMVNYI